MIRTLLPLVPVLVFTAGACGHASVELADGTALHGRITREYQDAVVLRATATDTAFRGDDRQRIEPREVTIPRGQIVEVRRHNPAAMGVAIGGTSAALASAAWFAIAIVQRDDCHAADHKGEWFPCLGEDLEVPIAGSVMGVNAGVGLIGWIVYAATTGTERGGADRVRLRPAPGGVGFTF